MPTYLHWNICKEINNNIKAKWYENEPLTVSEKDDITILWDMPIQTDRDNKKEKTNVYSCIDIVIPTDKNTSIKVTG